MCPFAEGEEVEELGDVVPPDLVVSGLFLEARADSCALLLDDGALVGDGLGGADVANELLHCDASPLSAYVPPESSDQRPPTTARNSSKQEAR